MAFHIVSKMHLIDYHHVCIKKVCISFECCFFSLFQITNQIYFLAFLGYNVHSMLKLWAYNYCEFMNWDRLLGSNAPSTRIVVISDQNGDWVKSQRQSGGYGHVTRFYQQTWRVEMNLFTWTWKGFVDSSKWAEPENPCIFTTLIQMFTKTTYSLWLHESQPVVTVTFFFQ